jgi:hypothetical protein
MLLAKKYECGILLLENLKFGEKPMKMHDKSKIMTVDQVSISPTSFCAKVKLDRNFIFYGMT